MSAAQVQSELSKGTIRPAYLLGGSEPLLRDDVLAAIEAAVLGDGPRDFNLDRLEVGAATPGRLEEALATLPVMAERRLVVLRENEGRGAKLDANWGVVIEDSVASAGPDSPTVLVVVTAKADKRSKWVKAFKDPALFVECEAPKKARELAGFLAAEAKGQGVDLDPEAAALLADRVGPQLLLLRQEIEKASLLAGPGERVTRKHVEATVATVAEEPIWDLTDAIGQGRTAEAIDLLSRLIAQGSAPPMILGALASHFRRLVRVGHGESVAGPPFVVKKLTAQARRYPPRRLVTCLRAIHRADVELKGASVMRSERALEQLVLGLAS